LWKGCTTSADCYERLDDGKFWWFFNSGAKSNFDGVTNASTITYANWKKMLSTWNVTYCLNTNEVVEATSSITIV